VSAISLCRCVTTLQVMSSWQSSIPYSIILSAATSRASVCRMYRRPVLAVLRAVPVDWLYSHRRRRRRTRKPTVDTTASFITRQSTVVMLLQSLCAYASFTGGGGGTKDMCIPTPKCVFLHFLEWYTVPMPFNPHLSLFRPI